jgi:hypothetical protein
MGDYSIRKVRYEELDSCADVIRRSFGTVVEEFGLTAENCPTNAAFLKTERLVSELLKRASIWAILRGTLIGFMD